VGQTIVFRGLPTFVSGPGAVGQTIVVYRAATVRERACRAAA
jgi:hypothetical protein